MRLTTNLYFHYQKYNGMGKEKPKNSIFPEKTNWLMQLQIREIIYGFKALTLKLKV